MNKDEALRLALEAFKSITWVNSYNDGDYLTCNFKSVEQAITAIKATLEAKDEPVAWEQFYLDIGKNQFAYLPPSPFSISGKPQSSQQEANEFNPDWDTQAVLVEEIQRMAKRIEELEAQTRSGDKDEPFGYFRYDLRLDAWVQSRDSNQGAAFYTTPPQRTWVGLTDKEVNGFSEQYWDDDNMSMHSLIKAIEAKLKEKNT